MQTIYQNNEFSQNLFRLRYNLFIYLLYKKNCIYHSKAQTYLKLLKLIII